MRRHMNKTYDYHNTFNYDNVVRPKLTVVIFHWFSCAFRYVYIHVKPVIMMTSSNGVDYYISEKWWRDRINTTKWSLYSFNTNQFEMKYSTRKQKYEPHFFRWPNQSFRRKILEFPLSAWEFSNMYEMAKSKVKSLFWVPIYAQSSALETLTSTFPSHVAFTIHISIWIPSPLPAEYTAAHTKCGATAEKPALTGTHLLLGREKQCSVKCLAQEPTQRQCFEPGSGLDLDPESHTLPLG